MRRKLEEISLGEAMMEISFRVRLQMRRVLRGRITSPSSLNLCSQVLSERWKANATYVNFSEESFDQDCL